MGNKKAGKNLKQKKIKTAKPQKNTRIGKFKKGNGLKQKKQMVPEKQLKKNLGRELTEHKSTKLSKKPKLRERKSNVKNFKRNQKAELKDQNEASSPARGRKRKLKQDTNNSQEFKKMKKTDPNNSNVESETETEPEQSKKKKRRSRLKKKRTNIEGADETSKIAPNAGKFLLINLIKTYLKEKVKTIPVSKMQQRVLKKYCQLKGVEESPKLVKEFHQSLKSTFGVVVIDDVVKLVNR
uniref:Uncharacterized protein n=1 Tax=Photinus pyralis TaxID=7054 RepID=A0A1Y1L6H5_PHOPY